MIKKQLIKSCCGSKAYIFITETAVNRATADQLRKQGYVSPQHFDKSGVFYVEYKGLKANASFGATKVTVRCASANCAHLLKSFEDALDSLTMRKTSAPRPLSKK